LYYFAFLPTFYKGSCFVTSSPAFVVVVYLEYAVLTGVRWNLNVVSIFITFVTRKGTFFFIYYLPLVPFPLKIPCSIHVPTSSFGCSLFED
jgi:hypothetical protein